MEFDINIPIYIQIVQEIKKRIIFGQMKPGDKIPSVRDFADELRVNPNTVSRSYQELERMNITETRRGMGTFIVDDVELIQTIKNEFSESLVDRFIKQMNENGFTDSEILQLIENRIKGN